ncbi:hypothetical protein MKX01_000316 [Papaver californicum]|nr:hypothetical protein MKX01_000316 [Papaver californicum]
MEFWPEFLASSWGKEFVAGGFGGMAGVVSGYPLDTLKIRLQRPSFSNTATKSAFGVNIVSSEGPCALYKGMAAPLTSVSFQSAMVFQAYAILSQAFNKSPNSNDPPSYRSVALGGFGTGALQSFLLSPVELVKIRLQLQSNKPKTNIRENQGPRSIIKSILKKEGLKGLYRGLTITVLRDAPGHGREATPGCRKTGQETLKTMLVAGGLAGVVSWVACYPLDVVRSRLQAQTQTRLDKFPPKYLGIVDCFCKSVQEEGYSVLWRGLGAAIARAFVVNGAIFTAYEVSLRVFFSNNQTEDNGL